MRAFLLGLASATLVASLAIAARADVGPPPSCPPGQQQAYLYGHYCAPIECQSDKECGEGASCAGTSLCLHNRGSERPSPALEWKGPCHEASDCAPNDACVAKRFCVARAASANPSEGPSAPPAGPSAVQKHGCGCEVAGSERGEAAAGLALLIAIAATVTRRRR